MAAIGKIREQSTLLLIVIGGAMVAFVLGDIFSRQGQSPGDQYVGEVMGEEINLMDYEQRVAAQKESMSSIGQPISSAQDQQIRNQVWNNMVQEKVLYTELNDLGMKLSQDEFDDIRFGENIRQDFLSNQNFVNQQTGQFDPTAVQGYFAQMQQMYPLYYNSQVTAIVNQRLYEKYNNLVQKGIYVNTLEGKDEFYRQEQKVSFSFVSRDYSSVPDSTVSVSESELKAYYNEHKEDEQFDRDAEVDVKFVVWNVEPTAEDEEEIQNELSDIKSNFANAKSDSLFVLKYSDSKNTQPTDVNAQGNEMLQAAIDTASEGTVIGPYKIGTRYALTKITQSGMEEQATSRHILLSNQTEKDMDVLKSRADSIIKVIRQKDNFEEMVTEFSEDPGSVSKGGVYDWFDRKTMVPEFTEASFDKPIGSLNVVETSYGVHIVEPLDKREVKTVKGLTVDQPIEPSNNTFNAIYDEANKFSIDAETAEGMEAMAEEKGFELKDGNDISVKSRNLPTVASSSEAVRWAHNPNESEVGNISQPFEFNNKIVVVGLLDRREAGVAPFDRVKEEIKPDVILEKKKEMFVADMQGKSLDELTSEFDLDIKVATNVTEKKPTLPGGASEAYIVGYALSMPVEEVSKPLEGNRGVYVIQVDTKTDVEPREEYLTFKDELEDNKNNRLGSYTSGVYRALKDFANVKDERSSTF